MQFGVGLAVCSCLFLPACRKEGGEKMKSGQAGPTTITLSADNNGNCVQNQGGSAVTNATVLSNQSAVWCAVDQSGNKLALDLQFAPGASPFAQNQFTATAGNCTSPSGMPTSAVERIYPYQQIIINGKQCGVGSDGVRIKPGN
jgi:hypothetical protein